MKHSPTKLILQHTIIFFSLNKHSDFWGTYIRKRPDTVNSMKKQTIYFKGIALIRYFDDLHVFNVIIDNLERFCAHSLKITGFFYTNLACSRTGQITDIY